MSFGGAAGESGMPTNEANSMHGMNETFSLCIPTYNRAELLDDTLEQLISVVEPHGVPICVSDNASSDNTELVVAGWRKKYPYLFYRRNERNLDSGNIPAVLKMARTRYAWLMGDRSRISGNAVETLLNIAGKDDYDMIIVNSGIKLNADGFAWRGRRELRRVTGIPSAVYTDGNRLLAELGWHMTLINSLIFRASVIEGGRFDLYTTTDFAHFLTVFDYLSRKDFSVYWCDLPLISTAQGGSSLWLHEAFDIWISRWMQAVNSLPPAYSDTAKQTCIKAHGIQTGLFSIKSMSFFRGHNIYNWAVFRKYYGQLPSISNRSRIIFLLIALIPRKALLLAESIIRLFVRDLVRFSSKK
jgi:abequosyltransferase